MIRSRYRRILWFFARLLLGMAFWDLFLPRFGLGYLAERSRPNRLRRAAISFRALAVQMGGVLIKVGQFLSARVDILPPEFTRELAGLQDEVPPAPFEGIRRVVEAEFDAPLEACFTSFEHLPLAAASLGQVHCARISPMDDPSIQTAWCQDVVVKVLRPGIERLIETDLAALETVGSWLHRYRPIRKRANIPALLREFERILYEEVDYLNEGRNAEVFATHFKDFAGVRVPRVCWERTTRCVLTLENVLAIKITDYGLISEAGVSRAQVASRLLNTYLKQIFEDGFFHADPHPGNLFVQPLDSSTLGTGDREFILTFVDFGMTGQVPANLRAGLRELLIGVGTRDAARVVRAYKLMDLLLPDADLARLEKAEARVFDRFWGKNMTELTSVSFEEMKGLADEFRDLIYEMPFQVPQNIIFLARCVGILSGICTGLDPEFNLWAHLAPYARKVMAEEASHSRENWLQEAERYTRLVLTLPYRVDAALTRLERGEVAVRNPDVSRQVRRLSRAARGLGASIVFAAMLLAAVLLFLNHELIPAALMALLSLGSLLYSFLNLRGED